MNVFSEQEFLNYLSQQSERRRQQASDTLSALTPREAMLVREAAVMGYVLGNRDGKIGQFEIPADSWITQEAVLGCISQNDSNPNHFKLIAAAAEGRRPRVRKGADRA